MNEATEVELQLSIENEDTIRMLVRLADRRGLSLCDALEEALIAYRDSLAEEAESNARSL